MCGIAGFLNPRNNDKKTEKEIYNTEDIEVQMMKEYFWKMAVH